MTARQREVITQLCLEPGRKLVPRDGRGLTITTESGEQAPGTRGVSYTVQASLLAAGLIREAGSGYGRAFVPTDRARDLLTAKARLL